MIAQRTDLLSDHEIAMANAVPKLIPDFTISLRSIMLPLCVFVDYSDEENVLSYLIIP